MKTILLFFIVLGISSKLYCQDADILNVSGFDGIYLATNDSKNCHLLNNGHYFFFFLNEQNNIDNSMIRFGTFGFYSKDINVDNLVDLKFQRIGTDQDNVGFISSDGGVVGYEFETGNRSLNLYNQNAFFYQKMYALPQRIINQIRLIGMKKHIDVEKFLYSIETIGIDKALIYTLPDIKSKMYLLKGDKVKILEENNDWLKFEYKGKKTINGWLKKKDLE